MKLFSIFIVQTIDRICWEESDADKRQWRFVVLLIVRYIKIGTFIHFNVVYRKYLIDYITDVVTKYLNSIKCLKISRTTRVWGPWAWA